jgi:hypothetical protein
MTDDNAPLMRIVRGHPTPAELAALVAVLASRSAGTQVPGSGTTAGWSSYWNSTRSPLRHGPGAWRSSALPG